MLIYVRIVGTLYYFLYLLLGLVLGVIFLLLGKISDRPLMDSPTGTNHVLGRFQTKCVVTADR